MFSQYFINDTIFRDEVIKQKSGRFLFLKIIGRVPKCYLCEVHVSLVRFKQESILLHIFCKRSQITFFFDFLSNRSPVIPC